MQVVVVDVSIGFVTNISGGIVIAMKEDEILREIIDAKNNAQRKAGIVKISDIGDTEHSDANITPLHTYENEEKCDCKCHPNKQECMNCYDHPIHLKNIKSQ